MDNQIICPHCKNTLANNAIIESAANGEDLGGTSLTCDCGERISFWAITAQLRDQKKPRARFVKWLRGLFKS